MEEEQLAMRAEGCEWLFVDNRVAFATENNHKGLGLTLLPIARFSDTCGPNTICGSAQASG
jgi:hypothetical protein